MVKLAAIYSRVSSDQQRENHTIVSQTEAVKEFARNGQYDVPKEWVFEDDGYSGANLLRPGLEQIRDLAASGQIQAVLILSPDRLSRKYAYQVLLMEELARNGVEAVFVKAPRMETPEDQLLLQFQGMIAEYERAQILERSRRGKRQRAKQGEVSVLSGAPYGYRYVRKTQESAGFYEVVLEQAEVVRKVYALYTVDGLSIGAITVRLNEEGLPTKKSGVKWERSSVWSILKNPAYRGMACFGKTHRVPRQRLIRTARLKGGRPTQGMSSVDRPREEWIEIPVPALVSPETFALAEELLAQNKKHSLRRTKVPSLLQGLLYCKSCSYTLYRSSTRTSARTIYYYRCLGSDAYRYGGKPFCDQKPIRQDALDQVVWAEVLRLLEDPTLIQNELNRRLEAARQSDPSQRRLETLKMEEVRVRKSMERLLTAYQEELMSLEELRQRMPALKQRDQAVQNEIQSLMTMAEDQTTILRLSEILSTFRERLQKNAETLEITERRRIMKLLVKEVAVGHNAITIRHSIPVHPEPSGGGNPEPSGSPTPYGAPSGQSSPLRSVRHNPALRRSGHGGGEELTVNKPCLEPLLENPLIRWDIGHQPVMV
ncbi:MAG: recombinase family protein, partial [Leptospirales bacterium]